MKLIVLRSAILAFNAGLVYLVIYNLPRFPEMAGAFRRKVHRIRCAIGIHPLTAVWPQFTKVGRWYECVACGRSWRVE